MASKEEIQKKNIEEANEALSKQLNLVSDIQDKMAFLIKSSKDKYTQDKLALDLTRQAVSFTQKLTSEYDSIKDVEKDIAKQKKIQNEVARTQITLTKEIGKEGVKRLQFITNQEKGLTKSAQKLAEMRAAEAAGVKGAKESADKLSQSLYSRTKSLATQKENLSAEEKQLMLLNETADALEGNNAHLDEQLRRQTNLVKSQSLFTSAISGASKALSSLGFGDLGKKLGLESAAKKAKEMTYTLTDGGKKSLGIFGKMRVGIASFGSALKTALGPLALISIGVSLFNKFKEVGAKALAVQREYNQQMVDMQRSLGVSSGIASKLYSQTQGVGRAMGLTADQAASAGTAIYGQLDGVEKLSNSTAGLFMKLNAHGGVSAETLGKIYQLSKLTGTEAGKVADNIAKQSQKSIKELKLNISMRQVMDGVANTSNRLKISMKGSGAEIVKAVTATKKLGMEMAGIESVMDSLLNIEDSLAAEMEAELLTGQDLNLEKARAAALNNDAEEVAKELSAQGITQEKFAGMNRIQQDAIAKAMGMSSSDMADMLNNSSKNKAENQQLLETQRQGAKAMMGAASAMEAFAQAQKDADAAAGKTGAQFAKYEHAMLRLKTAMAPILDAILVPIGEIVTSVVNNVAKWLEDTDNIKMITETIKSTFEGIKEFVTPIFEMMIQLAEDLMPVISAIWDKIYPIISSIKDTILEIVGSVGSLISKLFEGNTEFTAMEKTIGIIAAAVAGFYGTMKLIQGVQWTINKATVIYQGIVSAIAATKAIIDGLNKKEEISLGKRILMGMRDAIVAGVKAVAQIAGMSAATFGAAAGIALAAGAAAAIYFGTRETKMNDGVIPPSGGRVLNGPEGAIKFNDKDTIVAGTDLFGGSKGGNSSDGAVVTELQRVSSLLQQLLNKEGGVYIDGNKVGATIALTNYQQQ